MSSYSVLGTVLTLHTLHFLDSHCSPVGRVLGELRHLPRSHSLEVAEPGLSWPDSSAHSSPCPSLSLSLLHLAVALVLVTLCSASGGSLIQGLQGFAISYYVFLVSVGS